MMLRRIGLITLAVALVFVGSISAAPMEGSQSPGWTGYTSLYPHSAVAQVYYPGGGSCSGFVFDRYHVLVCGHCVWENGDYIRGRAVIIPGKKGDDEPFGRFYETDVQILKGWTRSKDRSYDVAIIETDRPIGDYTGTIPLLFPGSRKRGWFRVRAISYPGGYSNGGQYYEVCEARHINEALLETTCDAEGGTSGAPIYIKDERTGQRWAIGVIISRSNPSGFATRGNPNYAVFLGGPVRHLFERQPVRRRVNW